MSAMDWIEGEPSNEKVSLGVADMIVFERQDAPGQRYGFCSGPSGLLIERGGADARHPYSAVARWRLATDLDRFLELYRSFGIELTARRFENRRYGVGHLGQSPPDGWEVQLVSGGYQSPPFGGSTGMFSLVIFDLDGKFVEQGFWE